MNPLERAIGQVKDQLHAEAAARAPHEAVGLIGCRTGWFGPKLRVYACENGSQSPETSFLVPPLEQVRHVETMAHRGERFWGVFHSHVHEGPQPSERDRTFAAQLPSHLVWVIVGLAPPDGEPEIWCGRLG